VAHWGDVHGELAKDIERLRRYVQNRRSTETDLGLPVAIYDGIAEVWFDDMDAAEGMGEDPQYLDGCRVDEPNFLEVDQMAFTVTDEEALGGDASAPAAPGSVKLMQLVRRPDGLESAEFVQRWGRGDDTAAGVELGAIRHLVNRSLPATLADEMWWPDADKPDGEAPFDGIREIWWPNIESFRRARGGSAEAWQALADPALVDTDRSSAILAHEYCVIWP
jgi:hypothetical protein